MCVVSMISDHYYDKWKRYVPDDKAWPWPVVPDPYAPLPPQPYTPPQPSPITPDEVEEFRRLLERAREYDRRNNEPDCEMEDKKRRLQELADQLGVKIDFL